jgi:transposase
MRYIGLDIHMRMTAICVLDDNGKLERQITIRGHWAKVFEALKKIPPPFAICYEASNGYGFLYDGFSRLTDRVVVAHPGQLRLIFRSKRKNDRIDAQRLAKLLYLDEVPPVYVPGQDVRGWRRLIVFRQCLIDGRTRVKNRLRNLLRQNGIQAPDKLWNKPGLAWLTALAFPSPGLALERDLLMSELQQHQERVGRVENELNRMAATHPGVQLLRTIPGVGPRTAEAVTAWIDQPGRFTKNKAIGSYFGLVPCQDASAGRNHLGHITRQGPSLVRKLMIEATWQAIRRSPRLREHYRRIHRNDPDRKKIAIVATAHHILRVMLAMLTSGRSWSAQAA